MYDCTPITNDTTELWTQHTIRGDIILGHHTLPLTIYAERVGVNTWQVYTYRTDMNQHPPFDTPQELIERSIEHLGGTRHLTDRDAVADAIDQYKYEVVSFYKRYYC